MNAAQMVPIVYIGKKDYKTDNLNHTKTVWKKPGDVQPYPVHLAAALLRHPDVWRLGAAKDLARLPVVDDPIDVVAGEQRKEPDETVGEARGPDMSSVPPLSQRTLE